MLAALQRGTTLVVDRYAFSGVAFTAAKGTAGLDLDWCRVRARLYPRARTKDLGGTFYYLTCLTAKSTQARQNRGMQLCAGMKLMGS